ncbi:MAG TPA: hypothetical protein PKC98_11145 [Candidatus Melainabacteria bacterium]|nr:hypothetical protein [Candidatus Melainabacteria bacterium]
MIISPESEGFLKAAKLNRSLERYLKYHGISPSRQISKESLPDIAIGSPRSGRDLVLIKRRVSNASIYGITCDFLSRLYPASSLAADSRYKTRGEYSYQYLHNGMRKDPFQRKGLYR